MQLVHFASFQHNLSGRCLRRSDRSCCSPLWRGEVRGQTSLVNCVIDNARKAKAELNHANAPPKGEIATKATQHPRLSGVYGHSKGQRTPSCTSEKARQGLTTQARNSRGNICTDNCIKSAARTAARVAKAQRFSGWRLVTAGQTQ